jgi:hypothetical protein
MKKLMFCLVSLTMLIGGISSASANEMGERAAFTDIETHWAKLIIEAGAAAGYIGGYPDGSFKPDASITRAEFVAIVTRASQLEDEGAKQSFEDVNAGHWAIGAIQKGIGMGLIVPSDMGNQFNPDQALTRSGMVKWLVNGLERSDPTFTLALQDTENTILPFTEFFKSGFNEIDIPYIAIARGTGLVGGFPDGSFGPDKTTTRAEVVVLLERYLTVEGKQADEYKALNELREVGLYGTNVKTIGNVRWIKDFQGKEAPFPNGFNKDLVVGNDIGTMQLHRYIIVDPELTSIYTKMFADSILQELASSRDVYLFFSDMTVTFNRDLSGSNTFTDALDKVSGTTFSSNLPDEYGFEALRSIGSLEMLKKELTNRFWSNGTLTRGRSVDITCTLGLISGFILDGELLLHER